MTEKRFTLRMKEEVFNYAKITAAKNNRSVAKEIEYALNRYYFAKPFLDYIIDEFILKFPNLKGEELKEARIQLTDDLEIMLKAMQEALVDALLKK